MFKPGNKERKSDALRVMRFMLVDALPLEAHSSNRRSYVFSEKWRRNPAWPSRLSGSARFLKQHWMADCTLLSCWAFVFSCALSYIMICAMSIRKEKWLVIGG